MDCEICCQHILNPLGGYNFTLHSGKRIFICLSCKDAVMARLDSVLRVQP